MQEMPQDELTTAITAYNDHRAGYHSGPNYGGGRCAEQEALMKRIETVAEQMGAR